MYRAFHICAAWTIHGYIGTALLIAFRADACDRKEFWFQRPNTCIPLQRSTLTDCRMSEVATSVHGGWTLANEHSIKHPDETSDDTTRLLDSLSSSAEALLGYSPPPGQTHEAMSAAESFCTQPHSHDPVGDTVRISEDDADPLPSAVLAESPSDSAAAAAAAAHAGIVAVPVCRRRRRRTKPPRASPPCLCRAIARAIRGHHSLRPAVAAELTLGVLFRRNCCRWLRRRGGGAGRAGRAGPGGCASIRRGAPAPPPSATRRPARRSSATRWAIPPSLPLPGPVPPSLSNAFNEVYVRVCACVCVCVYACVSTSKPATAAGSACVGRPRRARAFPNHLVKFKTYRQI
jgi:hypothetical protein